MQQKFWNENFSFWSSCTIDIIAVSKVFVFHWHFTLYRVTFYKPFIPHAMNGFHTKLSTAKYNFVKKLFSSIMSETACCVNECIESMYLFAQTFTACRNLYSYRAEFSCLAWSASFFLCKKKSTPVWYKNSQCVCKHDYIERGVFTYFLKKKNRKINVYI